MPDRGHTTKQMGDASEMLVAAELTLAGVPAMKAPDNWPDYDVIAQPWDRGPQQISVKARTPGEHHSRLGFNPATCHWLAVVLLEKEGRRRIFVIPSDIAKAHSTTPARAKKGRPCALSFAKLLNGPLSCYENNFRLRHDP